MKKICERALNWFQIYDCEGNVRLCSWTRDGKIGSLMDHSVEELYHDDCANRVRERLTSGDYSECKMDACPYLAMNEINEHLVEYDVVPKYPEEIYLGFEQVCNYHCTSCSVHKTMLQNKNKNLEEKYDVIESRIKDILPYVKRISANGCGELFVSKRTLKLLSEWEPKADPSEVQVALETNGSLFDAEHWKQIENLGQYNLCVAITVMSFDEEIYQYLSGSKFPISQIENNLLFVKKLREQGIINYFEIATVVQEQNFRTIPEFAKRCVEEFGADYVRIRPYEPWGAEEPDVAWFNDVRNPRHPYYQEYKKMMNDPIFKNPKVHDWSGGRDAECDTYSPYQISELKRHIVTDICLNIKEIVKKAKLDESNHVVVYGIADIGKVLVRQLETMGVVVDYIIDNYCGLDSWNNYKIYSLEKCPQKDYDSLLVVTPVVNDEIIFYRLKALGYRNCISIRDICNDGN